MPTHEFTLCAFHYLVGTFEEHCEKLYEAGCDDATICRRDRCTRLTFARAAATREEAIASAVRDVRKAGVGCEVGLVIDEEGGSR